MKKWVCTVCGYVWEGENPPEKCPQCGVPASKFVEQKGERTWAAEHVVGVAKGCPQEILDGLRANFAGECSEVGMYLAMARIARATRKSASTGRRPRMKRPSMRRSSPSCWARS